MRKALSESAKENLSKALKAKWASGTRKPTPKSAYEKSAESLRRRVKEKGRWDKLTREICSRGGKTVTEKQIQKNREIAKAKIGGRNPPGPSARGVGHWKAKFWMLWTPDRNFLSGVNLNEIVRTNAHLFDEKDLRQRGSVIYAAKRLAGLFVMQKRRGKLCVFQSWKGWRAVDKAEMVKDVVAPEGHEIKWKPQKP
jgi:hypothetical protein